MAKILLQTLGAGLLLLLLSACTSGGNATPVSSQSIAPKQYA